MFRSIYWEIKMDVVSTLRYRFGTISDIILYSLLLVFFLASDSGKSYQDIYRNGDYKELLVIGYLAWIYAVTSITSISQIVMGELRQGTFYKKYNSRYPLQMLLFGRVVAALFIQSVVVITLIIVSVIIGKVSFQFHLSIIFAIIFSTVGMYGIGLIVSGFSIFYKKVGAITYIIQLGLLFVTDTIPTSDKLLSITKVLPLTICNEVIRNEITGNTKPMQFVLLIVSSACFLTLGSIVFRLFIHKAKKKGNLLFY